MAPSDATKVKHRRLERVLMRRREPFGPVVQFLRSAAMAFGAH